MGGGIEIDADQALGGAGLLDLGDQRVAGRCLGAERRREAARGGKRAGAGLHVGEADRGLAAGDFRAGGVENFVEDGWHQKAIQRWSRRAAAPLSMVSAANAAPSAQPSARSATMSAAAALSSTASR